MCDLFWKYEFNGNKKFQYFIWHIFVMEIKLCYASGLLELFISFESERALHFKLHELKQVTL